MSSASTLAKLGLAGLGLTMIATTPGAKEHSARALGGLALTGGSLAWLLANGETSAYALSTLINKDTVSSLARQLPQGEDEFAIAAWEIAGDDIEYSDYGSELVFRGDRVRCERCLLANQTLHSGAGNCVAKSILLTSLLRNRFDASRVYMVIGQAHLDHIGGHAWVTLQRGDGEWYLMEATLAPTSWTREADLTFMYEPEAYVNDQTLQCRSSSLCVSIKKANCLCHTRELWGAYR